MSTGHRNSNCGENGTLRGYLYHFHAWRSCSSQSICQPWDTLTWSDIGPCWFMSRHRVTRGRSWYCLHFSAVSSLKLEWKRVGIQNRWKEGGRGLYRSRFIMDMHTWIGYSIQTRLECHVWHAASGSVKLGSVSSVSNLTEICTCYNT
jgi:hypothetical protein